MLQEIQSVDVIEGKCNSKRKVSRDYVANQFLPKRKTKKIGYFTYTTQTHSQDAKKIRWMPVYNNGQQLLAINYGCKVLHFRSLGRF